MTPFEVSQLLEVLRANGVSHFEDGSIKIDIAPKQESADKPIAKPRVNLLDEAAKMGGQ